MNARWFLIVPALFCACGDVVVGNFGATEDETGEPIGALAVVVGDDRLRVLSTDAGQSWGAELSEGPDPELVLYAVEFGAGQFVAVGGETSSRIERSLDGESWEVVYQGQGAGLRDIVYTGTRWVAVGIGGEVLRSDDGVNWEGEVVPIVNTKLSAVASDGAQLLLAVGDGDIIGSFDGGQSWLHKFEDGLNHAAVAYGGAFVVADLDGTIHIAEENLGSFVHSQSIAPALSDLIHAQGRYWAVGGQQLREAADPMSWTEHTLDSSLAHLDYRDGVFLGIGGGQRFHSTDALGWVNAGSGSPGHAVALGEAP
jgi:hypothetical protein